MPLGMSADTEEPEAVSRLKADANSAGHFLQAAAK